MDLTNYKNIHLIDHPLLKHKITALRNIETRTAQFKVIVEEIAMIEGYEALRNAKVYDAEIVTPIEKTIQPKVDKSSLCFVPILRAGLGMADGLAHLLPGCTFGHIGLYRDETTKKPVEYYCKLPADIANREVYLLDPMLATGGSAIDAVKLLKKHGVKKITFICIIAAPEGIKAFTKENPDIEVYVGAIDRELNENAYICPGLGDCGDRIFGTTNK